MHNLPPLLARLVFHPLHVKALRLRVPSVEAVILTQLVFLQGPILESAMGETMNVTQSTSQEAQQHANVVYFLPKLGITE